MKKILGLILALLGMLMLVVGLASPANAKPPTKHFPYEVTQTWYKQGGTLDDIWPQDLTPIDCGGISQTDTYTIKNKKMERDYSKLIAKGVLNGPQDDAEFSPHNYHVDLLGRCFTIIPVPAEPSKQPATCDHEGSFSIPFDTETVSWTADGKTWNDGHGAVVGELGVHTVVAHANAAAGYLFTGNFDEMTWIETNEAQLTKGCTSPPPPAASTPPPTKHVVSHPKPHLSVAPAVSVHRNVVQAKPVSQNKPLAATGSHTGQLIALGLGLVVLGALMLGLTIRSGKRA